MYDLVLAKKIVNTHGHTIIVKNSRSKYQDPIRTRQWSIIRLGGGKKNIAGARQCIIYYYLKAEMAHLNGAYIGVFFNLTLLILSTEPINYSN